MNKNIGYWIIGGAFFVQVLFPPWVSSITGKIYLPFFTEPRGIRLDMKGLVIQLIITAMIAVGYAYVIREKGEG